MSDDAPDPKRLAVLLVEDDPIVRNVIELALTDGKHRVLAVSNAFEALEVLDRGAHFDLLISDVEMPGMTGRQLAERMQESQPHMRTLLMSGYATPRRGVIPFLQKPFLPDELRAIIVDLFPEECGPQATRRRVAEVTYRKAASEDVPAIMSRRRPDRAWGPADRRTAAYLEGTHHPQLALPPRVIFIGWEGDSVVGYIGGHLTQRYECDGELQYLWVAEGHRRRGVASGLFRALAGWFTEHGASRVCVDVLPDNAVARSFYRRHGATDLNPHWLVWDDISSCGND